MELQALPDQAFCRVHVDQRKQPCQLSVQACLRRQRMREFPRKFVFGLAFLFAGGVICMLFHPEFSVWRSGFVCMYFTVHCHCLFPNVSIIPDGSPTPVVLESPFPLPSLPKALAASGLHRIYRFAYSYFKYATVALGGHVLQLAWGPHRLCGMKLLPFLLGMGDTTSRGWATL